ncbi:MAG TPA: gamma carbonic anhydrase family protein [Candidatus Ozemobacteraceae bacterium]|nr:gamma carbonic anhydrase family protein [Candidatus Ozemobacteraceae bacterium]
MLIRPFQNKFPRVHESAFVAETAAVIGDVEIGAGSSIWYGVVLRGDINSIRIGADTNIQDNAIVHVDDRRRGGDDGGTVIGDRVTVGHGAIIHACRIGDNCLIGMGAVVLSRAKIGENCIVAAGAVVKEGMVVPPNSLVAGMPAVVKATLTPEKIAGLAAHAVRYAELGNEFRRSS